MSPLRGKIAQASLLLAFFSILGKVIGLWRDRILAAQFGASANLDIYYSAFRIPDLIFNLFILGATSSAIVPIFIEYYQSDKERAWKTAQNFLNVAFFAIAAASVVIFLFASPLSLLIAPGFSAEDRALLVPLMRLMLLSPLIFGISTIIGSILQSLERFAAFALAPILYNVGIIIGATYFVPYLSARGQEGVFGLGLGVVLGALLHLAVQLPVALRAGFRFGTAFNLRDQSLKRMLGLMLPRTLALGANNVGLTVVTAIASTIGVGSITILNLATNLQYVPVSVIGISLATAVFPRLSSHASANEMADFRQKLNQSFFSTFWMVGFAAVIIFIFRNQIVGTLFRVGAFESDDQALTASVLGIFMFSIVAQSLMHIMTRAFYALQNTKTPFWIAVFSVALNIVLSATLTFNFHAGVRGLAIATAIAYNANFLLLYFWFRKRYF